MLALYTASAIALNITDVIKLGPQWFPLITFILFVFLMSWILLDLKSANSKLLDNRPSITVSPIEKEHTLYLEVHNNGAEGIFRAQIELSAKDPSLGGLTDYNGVWRYSYEPETKILKGHKDYVKIADLILPAPSKEPAPISQGLNIWRFDHPAKPPSTVPTSSHWLGATTQSEDGSTRPLAKLKYELKITISSTPKLREGIFIETYKLNVSGWVTDSPPVMVKLPVLRKGDYQT